MLHPKMDPEQDRHTAITFKMRLLQFVEIFRETRTPYWHMLSESLSSIGECLNGISENGFQRRPRKLTHQEDHLG